MLQIILAALVAIAPAAAPAADPHKDHAGHAGMKHEGPCCPDGKPMDCCKDKPMPCCEKKAEAPKPAAEEHGTHEHAH